MQDKYNMTKEENIFLAKRCVVDTIWKSSHIEGINITYPETQALYDGGNIAHLRLDEIQTVNNLKHAWIFILNSIDSDSDIQLLKSINSLVGSNLIDRPGEIRAYDVSIGGTNWRPDIPDMNVVSNKLSELLQIPCITDRAISVMCYLMRSQLFSDGNKRTAMLFANKIMIENGKGIISIPIEEDINFGKELTAYYETGDIENLKNFIYVKCINGINYK